MNIIDVSTSRLREYENNPRNNDLAVEKVRYSIERFGFRFPVIIDMNYVIVAGHTRVRAAKELGIAQVPCIMADDLTEEQINFFRLVDNKTSEYSDWDFEKLKDELGAINLTLESNQLLLDQFELSAEVFDIDPEQAEIKIPTFNFMGDDAPKKSKPTVSTFVSEDPNLVTDGENDAVETDDEEIESSAPITADTESAVAVNRETPAAETNVSAFSATETSEEPATPVRPAPVVSPQFRFGEVMFFISQIELDRLNEKYADYLDSEEMLKRSFVSYLLEGVNTED